jgi:hypothetical protein
VPGRRQGVGELGRRTVARGGLAASGMPAIVSRGCQPRAMRPGVSTPVRNRARRREPDGSCCVGAQYAGRPRRAATRALAAPPPPSQKAVVRGRREPQTRTPPPSACTEWYHRCRCSPAAARARRRFPAGPRRLVRAGGDARTMSASPAPAGGPGGLRAAFETFATFGERQQQVPVTMDNAHFAKLARDCKREAPGNEAPDPRRMAPPPPSIAAPGHNAGLPPATEPQLTANKTPALPHAVVDGLLSPSQVDIIFAKVRRAACFDAACGSLGGRRNTTPHGTPAQPAPRPPAPRISCAPRPHKPTRAGQGKGCPAHRLQAVLCRCGPHGRRSGESSSQHPRCPPPLRSLSSPARPRRGRPTPAPRSPPRRPPVAIPWPA